MKEMLDSHTTEEQRALLRGMETPHQIQAFLDTCAYRPEYDNLTPVQVMAERKAHCLDGAIFAAAALRRIGYPPLLVDIFPDPGMDDDHVLAVFRRGGRWGAVAKSNFVGLRLREAVYHSLRELVMSYFEWFYNLHGVKTLRYYTRPLDLARFDHLGWGWANHGVDAIEKALLARARIPLLSPEIEAGLAKMDELTYKAGSLSANWDGVYKPKTQ